MKKLLFILFSIISLAGAQSEDFNIDDIKVHCDCDNEKQNWKIEKIDAKTAKKLCEHAKSGALGETRTPTS